MSEGGVDFGGCEGVFTCPKAGLIVGGCEGVSTCPKTL